MIGNDVVDLRLARVQSNWERRGYLDKIFTKPEQFAIKTAADPEVCLWILWSMKEAAYKVFNRETGIRAYIPFQMECSLEWLSGSRASGTVICMDSSYLTHTLIKDEIIHTVAVTPSEAGRNIYYINENEMVWKDNCGCPFMYDYKGLISPVSKSHHGRCSITVSLSY